MFKKKSEMLPYQYYAYINKMIIVIWVFTLLAWIVAAFELIPFEISYLMFGCIMVLKNGSNSQYLAAMAHVFIPSEGFGPTPRQYFSWAKKEIASRNNNKLHLLFIPLLCWVGAIPLAFIGYVYTHFLLGGLDPSHIGVQLFAVLLYLVSLRNLRRYVVVHVLLQLEAELLEDMREAADQGYSELPIEEDSESED